MRDSFELTILRSSCITALTINKCVVDDALRWISAEILFILLNWQLLSDSTIPKHHQDCFATHDFPGKVKPLAMFVKGNGSLNVLSWRFPRAPAPDRRCQRKQRDSRWDNRTSDSVLLDAHSLILINYVVQCWFHSSVFKKEYIRPSPIY